MRQRSLFLITLYVPILLFSQNVTSFKGIQWTTGLSWEQVKQKAKAENKYIFIDCYASWCVPCKKMDSEVYINDTVAKYINDKFISVKMQMDTSKQDIEEVKNQYADAHFILKQFQINSFPSYLFFSPDGKIVHRDMGYRRPKEFIEVVDNSLNPSRQYYTLLNNYQEGKKNFTVMPYLANFSKALKEKELAFDIGQYYVNNYLLVLPGASLFTKNNIEFIASYIQNTNEKSFNFFCRDSIKIDSTMAEKGFSQRMIDYSITNEKIVPMINQADKEGSEPKWNEMTKRIKKKFSAKKAAMLVLKAKVRWYNYKDQWPDYIKYLVIMVEKYGVGSTEPVWVSFFLNNFAWDVFSHSYDTVYLNKALMWSDSAIKLNNDSNKPVWMDTKANLLYKLGRKKEAILLEEEAADLAPNRNDIAEALEKMRRGVPTWPDK